jgi:hypothetical protein
MKKISNKNCLNKKLKKKYIKNQPNLKKKKNKKEKKMSTAGSYGGKCLQLDLMEIFSQMRISPF